jgi:hypothetical protein
LNKIAKVHQFGVVLITKSCESASPTTFRNPDFAHIHTISTALTIVNDDANGRNIGIQRAYSLQVFDTGWYLP